jgi:DNA-binding NarL/FixJ family response regulator
VVRKSAACASSAVPPPATAGETMKTLEKEDVGERNGNADKSALGKTKIYIIDDHPIMVQGLKELINNQRDMRVIGSSDDWHVALEQVKKIAPDLIILDVTLKDANGIEVLKNLKIHVPHIKILMLSMHDESLYAMRSLKAGAQGYIMKQEAVEKVLGAIRQVLAGEVYLSESMSKRTMFQLLGRGGTRTGSPLEDLSDRELEVFTLIGQGCTTRQIAEKLHLSIKTVETHRAHIKEKLNLKNSTELVQHAIHWRES